MGGLPKGWRNYSPVGQCIFGTKFLPFKVPLNKNMCRYIPKNEWFTPEILLRQCPKLRAIIDLTNTTRYYDPQSFIESGVCHRRIPNEGHGTLPPLSKLREFVRVVDDILAQIANEPDALIGVHCTHGLHRTGYFICYYMVSQMKMDPSDVVARFEKSRGHKMKRLNYVNDILTFKPSKRKQSSLQKEEKEMKNWRSERRPSFKEEKKKDSRSRHERNVENWLCEAYPSAFKRNEERYSKFRKEKPVENWRSEPREPVQSNRSNGSYRRSFHSSNDDKNNRKNGRSKSREHPYSSKRSTIPERKHYYPC